MTHYKFDRRKIINYLNNSLNQNQIVLTKDFKQFLKDNFGYADNVARVISCNIVRRLRITGYIEQKPNTSDFTVIKEIVINY